jgi:hypothetical protein
MVHQSGVVTHRLWGFRKTLSFRFSAGLALEGKVCIGSVGKKCNEERAVGTGTFTLTVDDTKAAHAIWETA